MAATKARCRYNPDIIDQAVHTGSDIASMVYEVPTSLLHEGVVTTLDLKDAVKHELGLNPSSHQAPLYIYRWSNGEWRYFATIRPNRPAEWTRWVRRAQQMPDRYRIVRSKFNAMQARRKNPQDESDAMYEAFHGTPSTEQVIVEKEFHEHEHLAALGDLVECWIETPTRLLACIRFGERDRPLLSSNEEGTQLFIEGGDQEVDLKVLGMNGENWVKDRMVLGCFALPSATLEYEQRDGGNKVHHYHSWNIAYLTRKDFDQFEDVIYQHDLGEPDEGERKNERREPPYLEYEPRNSQLYVTGGQYHIERPAFQTSPGIEN